MDPKIAALPKCEPDAANLESSPISRGRTESHFLTALIATASNATKTANNLPTNTYAI